MSDFFDELRRQEISDAIRESRATMREEFRRQMCPIRCDCKNTIRCLYRQEEGDCGYPVIHGENCEARK